MNFIEAFRISIDSIWNNKMRSLLTMLGLIIGISSVVTIVSIGNGTQAQITENLQSLGVNKVSIYYSRSADFSPSDRIKSEDIDKIMENFSDELDGVTLDNSRSATIEENIDENSINIVASNNFTMSSEDLTLVSGRFINDFDIDSYKKNIVIDSDLATELFGGTNAAGQKMLIKTSDLTGYYNIVGVYEKEESVFGFSTSKAYIPYTTMDMVYNLKGQANGLTLLVKNDNDIDSVSSRVMSYIERIKSNQGEEKYTTYSSDSQIEMVSSTLGTITLFISAIAGISLVVGGIGVMNIMLVSVTERTREIGIRKSLGAKYSDIMLQFLIEAVTISLLGGIIGTVVGIFLINIAGSIVNINATLSIDSLVLAIAVSVSIGMFFGIYPANKAAKLDPIEALRYE